MVSSIATSSLRCKPYPILDIVLFLFPWPLWSHIRDYGLLLKQSCHCFSLAFVGTLFAGNFLKRSPN